MSNFNINKTVLGGRLTADVELKQTNNGTTVCSFTLAVNRRAREQQTDFINCTAWNKTAEFIAKYFGKGSALCVVGSIQTRTWQDNQGNKRYATEVVVDEALFVDGRNDADQAETVTPSGYTPDAYKVPETPNFEDVDDLDSLPF
jgi:single-strand DNA-binding protein